jgi:GNAT superfamily N-acetyltransferase
MYVSASVRGRGVGSLLIQAVEDWAVATGADRLCLHVVAENHPARRLYERHGLAVTGEVAREAAEDPLELEMCKRLMA